MLVSELEKNADPQISTTNIPTRILVEIVSNDINYPKMTWPYLDPDCSLVQLCLYYLPKHGPDCRASLHFENQLQNNFSAKVGQHQRGKAAQRPLYCGGPAPPSRMPTNEQYGKNQPG